MNFENLQYKLIALIILTLLVLPVLQMQTGIFEVRKLQGYVYPHEKPDFNVKDWLSGSFQNRYDLYFENNFGLRPWLVRINNQISFSISGKPKASDVVIGKENYLYELNYMKAYNGWNFLGNELLTGKIDSLERIKDSLQKYHTDLIICLAAGKGSFYPEYFPDKYYGHRSDTTNYLFYRRAFRERNFNLIDFNDWFLKMKDTSRYILLPKYGIHWSQYGAWLAADSLLKFVEKIRNVDLPDMKYKGISITNKPKVPDYDMGDGLNLLFKLHNDSLAYPEFDWITENKDTIQAVVIGDSYYWQLYTYGFDTIAFKPGGFWFYNEISYPGSVKVKDLDYIGAITKADIVILMATEATLDRFPFKFTRDFFEAFKIAADSE